MQKEELGVSLAMDTALFPVSGLSVAVADISKKYLKKKVSQKGSEGVNDSFKMKLGEGAVFKVKIAYQCAGLPIEYMVDLNVPTVSGRSYVPALERVSVSGTMASDYYGSYSMGVLLDNGLAISCEQRNMPADYLLAGQRYSFEISPGSQWGHDLRVAKLIGKPTREILFRGDVKLSDGDLGTGILVEPRKPVELTLKKPSKLSSIYLNWDESKLNHSVEAMVGGAWQVISPRGGPGLRPCSPVTTDRIRINLNSKKGATLREVRFVGDSGPEPKRTAIW